jgi:nucleotide-binding universal stress UspA family protein
MFKHILVAIDGSLYSQQALPTAIGFAQKFESDVFVLHVREHDRGRATVYSTETPAEATRLVADAVKAVRDAGIGAKGQLIDVAVGHVAKAIVEAAAADDIDLIVMGSRGLGDIGGLFLGSVTHRVMQQTDVPVLVVRGDAKKELATASAADKSATSY